MATPAPAGTPNCASKSWALASAEELASVQLPVGALPAPAAGCHAQFQFITGCRACLAQGQPLPCAMAELIALLLREVCSLRSAMARNALTCAGELGVDWRATVPFSTACALVGALASRASNSADKRFIRDLALLALQRCALALPCGDMLLFLLSQEAICRNKAAALVTASVADSCVLGAAPLFLRARAHRCALWPSTPSRAHLPAHALAPSHSPRPAPACCGPCLAPALTPWPCPLCCRAWPPSSPAAAPLRGPWQ